MAGFTSLWDFAAKLDSMTSIAEIGAAFLKETETLGFARTALLSQVDPLKPGSRALSFERNMTAWIAHYSREQYHLIDPIHDVGRRRATPFFWTGPDFRQGLTAAQNRLLDELTDARLGPSVILPLKAPGVPTTCCGLCVEEGEPLDPAAVQMAHSLAVFAHASAGRLLASRPPRHGARLTGRERQCLVLVARGKTDWDIGELLSLSERTVHHAIERAKRRFGVSTRVQAVVCAVHDGEITTDEIVG